jgi:DNA-binding CsgD family transcriptional regulator
MRIGLFGFLIAVRCGLLFAEGRAINCQALVREISGRAVGARARRGGEGIGARSSNHQAGDGGFHGRAAELEQLRVALEGLTLGRPARLLIAGAVGIGKSRLVSEAIATSSLAGLSVVHGRAEGFERDRPFGLFADALDLHSSSADPERATLGRLIVRARDPQRAGLRYELVGRITQLIDRICDAGPLVLFLEDLQWADPLSVGTIATTLEGREDRALGIVMTTRPLPQNPAMEEIFSRPPVGLERLDLRGLPSDAVSSLAQTISGGKPGPRLGSLLARAGGHPGYVINLLNGLREMGALWVEGGVADTDATRLPRTIHSAVMARIGQLSDSCQDLLTIAAVLGEPFKVSCLAAAADRTVPDLLTDLRQAMVAGLLTDVGGALCFRQELVRVVLYEETPASTRSSLHFRIGNTLLASGGDARVVASHLLRAVELEDTVRVSPEGNGATAAAMPSALEKLTKAERQVVRHVVEGLSNRVIGEWLFVSPRTVETHLTNIYAKLGVSSRVELATAVSRGMGFFARIEGRVEGPGGTPLSGEGAAGTARHGAATQVVGRGN